jgi:hypothetical protein
LACSWQHLNSAIWNFLRKFKISSQLTVDYQCERHQQQMGKLLTGFFSLFLLGFIGQGIYVFIERLIFYQMFKVRYVRELDLGTLVSLTLLNSLLSVFFALEVNLE